MQFLLIDEAAARAAVDPRSARLAVREALISLASGDAIAPGEIAMVLPHDGELHLKGAYLVPSRFIAFKVATGGFPAGGNSGGTLVIDAASGRPAAFIADGGWLTEMRTGAAGAVASLALGRADSRRIAVVGSGVQARFQIAAHREAFPDAEIRVWGRDPGKTREVGRETGAEPCETLEAATTDAQIVVTATSAREPVLTAAQVAPGMQITAVGADMIGKQELDPEIVAMADLVAADDPELAARVGELQHSPQTVGSVICLGDLLAGRSPGRLSPDAVTVCDLCGLGVEDAAMANLVLSSVAPTELRLGPEA